MAYCTVEELAQALRVAVTDQNRPWLQQCVDAAAIEIDDHVARFADDPIPVGNALANRVNVLRGVEWWKQNDAAVSGAVGMDQSGIFTAPRSSFTSRHGGNLTPLKQRFGIS